VGLTWLAYFCIRKWLEPVAAQTGANAFIVLTTWAQEVGCQLRLGFLQITQSHILLASLEAQSMVKLVLARADLVTPKMRTDSEILHFARLGYKPRGCTTANVITTMLAHDEVLTSK
jgi:hypothetical protein